jgi:hypothetical protein
MKSSSREKAACYDSKVLLGASTMVMLQVELLVKEERQNGFWSMSKKRHSKRNNSSERSSRLCFDSTGAYQCILIRDHLLLDSLF